MNINDAKSVLQRTHMAALNRGERASGMELKAPPGVGKSEGVFQETMELAKLIGKPTGLHVFMLATISSVDVKGFLLPQKNATTGVIDSTFSTPPWMPSRMNSFKFDPDGTIHVPGTWDGDLPEVGNLFLDEWGQADEEVKKPAAELIYKGGVGTSILERLWRVVAASNRVTDRSGVARELRFITNRRCELNVDAHLPTWLEWANAQPPETRPHHMTLSFAQKNPTLVFKDAVPAGNDPFCTPRTLCMLDRDMRALRTDADIKADRIPTDDITREVAAGWIGSAEAAQYFTHLKYADEIPELHEIESDPAKAKLPPNKDAQMVCGYMLAHNVTDKNAPQIMKYLERLNIEMQVLSIRAVVAQNDRSKHIIGTSAFGHWLHNNKKLLTASRG